MLGGIHYGLERERLSMRNPALPKLPGGIESRQGKMIRVAILVVIALVSALVFGPPCSSPETYRDIYETLDERQNNVLKLAFGAAIISTVLSALPDDTGSYLSSEYADFYTGFAIIVSVLLLEKYLMSTIGFALTTHKNQEL